MEMVHCALGENMLGTCRKEETSISVFGLVTTFLCTDTCLLINAETVFTLTDSQLSVLSVFVRPPGRRRCPAGGSLAV